MLRAILRRRIRELSCAPSIACAALNRWLDAHPEVTTVAAYSALPGEVDVSASRLSHPERRWVYPRVLDDHLTFHLGESLVSGAFGILEPDANSKEIPLAEINAFLCPGLAFDAQGGRLGRGRGFYDRLLAQVRPDVFKIGVCHDFQIVPDTFSEPHDVAMDLLIF